MASTKINSVSMSAAFIFAIAIAVVNGFGRFAYALLLPVMRDDLHWDYALSGWLNTANSFGYGLGALGGLFLLAKLRPASLFIFGLGITVLTLFLCGFTRDLPLMMIWRFVSGIGSAWVFACGGALVAAYYSQDAQRSAAAIAIFYAGGGLGILLSGLFMFPVLSHFWNWPAGWLVLGGVGLLFSLWPALLAFNVDKKGQAQTSRWSNEPVQWRALRPILIAYFLFGVGYIVYLTFVIAWLREMQLGLQASLWVWSVMGIAAIASGFVWRPIMSGWPPTRTFALSCLCTAAGTALPIFSHSLAGLLASAVLVGGSFFMAPGAMMALARVNLPQAVWAKAMNLFTFVFAIGQGLGPVLAGWIADSAGLNWAMAVGSVTLVIAAAIALLQAKKIAV
jgi:predicted MFS family arabinose efflux permease